MRLASLGCVFASVLIAACGNGPSPAAAFDALRAAARAGDLVALRARLSAAEGARMERELPGFADERSDGPALAFAAHGREIERIARTTAVGFRREGGGRAVLELETPGGSRSSLSMVREEGEWRVDDLGPLLRFDSARRDCLAALRGIGAEVTRRRGAGGLPAEAGSAFLQAVGGAAASGLRGPDRATLLRVAAGDLAVILAADGNGPDGRQPRHSDGVCVLWANGTAEFLPWWSIPGSSGGPVAVGPDSVSPLLRGLVFTE